MKPENRELNIEFSPGKVSYPIITGENLNCELAHLISEYYKQDKILLVTDDNVNELYGDSTVSLLEAAGFNITRYCLQPGEGAKNFSGLLKGYDLLVENKFQRDNLIMALGGGVVGDLAGFLAASYMRGIPLIQVPTTLLAQVDSSVGGKTAVNHASGKNLIGAFYQPQLVVIDIDYLRTLPLRELKTGIAEVIKHGLILDRDFFNFLRQHKDDIYNLHPQSVIHIVYRSCEMKADITIRDEKEQGVRALLNFGHTIAHALEAVTQYKKYTHGEAVAIGMRGAARLSAALGYLDTDDLDEIENVLDKYELPAGIGQMDIEAVYEAMSYDKKVKADKIRFILLKEIGEAFITEDIDKKLVMKILEGLK